MLSLQKRQDELYEQFLKNSRTTLYSHLADCYIENNKMIEAEDILNSGLRQYPADSMGHYVMGKLQYKLGNLKLAKAEFERTIKYQNECVSAYIYLIEIAEKEKISSLIKAYKDRLELVAPLHRLFEKVFEESTETVENVLTSEPEINIVKEVIPVKEAVPEKVKEISNIPDPNSFDDFDFASQIVTNDDKKPETKLEDKTELPITAIESNLNKTELNNEAANQATVAETAIALESNTEEIQLTEDSINISEQEEELEIVNERKIVYDDEHLNKKTSSDELSIDISEEEELQVELDDIKKPIEKASITNNHSINKNLPAEVLAGSVDSSLSVAKLIQDEDLSGELALIQPTAHKNKENEPVLVSSIMGEIYLTQGKFLEAKKIFEQLLAKEPDNKRIKRKIADIENIL